MVGLSLSWLAKKGKRSEWLLGKKIRGKVWKASKLSNTDLKETHGWPLGKVAWADNRQVLQLT